MEGERINSRQPKETCLFLLRASPASSGSESSARSSQEFELVPVATERQYAERAQDFVQRASPPLTNKPLAMDPKTQNSKPGRLAKLAMRQKLAPLKTIREPEPEAFQLPDLPRFLTIKVKAVDNSGNFAISSVGRAFAIDTNSTVSRSKSTDSPVLRQGLLMSAYSSSKLDELLPPLAYNPNKSSKSPTHNVTSEVLNQEPSTAAPNDLLLPLTYNPNELKLVASSTNNNTKIADKLGFPKSIQAESIIDDDILGEDSDDSSSQLHVPGHNVAADPVKDSQLEHSESHDELRKLYADIFGSNPYSKNGAPPTQEPSSTQPVAAATSSASEAEESTPPSTATSVVSSPASEKSDDQDMSSITKGFHNALTSIVKDKTRPLPAALEIPAKALALLGRSEQLMEPGTTHDPAVGVKKQSQESEIGTKLMDNIRAAFNRPFFGQSSRKQASEGIKPIFSTLAHGNSPKNECASYSRPTKLESVLGVHATEFTVDSSNSASDLDKRKSRQHSTLYAKLYSQVSKPSHHGSDASGLDSKSSNAHYVPQQVEGEPVTRVSASSTHTKLVVRMPFATSDDGLDNDDLGTHKTTYVGKRRLPGSIGASSVSSPSIHSRDFEHHSSARVLSTTSNHGIKKSLSTVDRGVHHVSKSPFETAPAWRPEQLSLNIKSAAPATNLEHGLSCERPKSPIKKAFSSTVEMFGRMMPAGSNTHSSQGSQETGPKVVPALKASVHPADQNRLFGDLEYIIQDTANRFLLYQHAHKRLSKHSTEKTARAWHQMNRPQVTEFLYPIAVQQKLVEHNLKNIIFHGPLAGNVADISAIMHTWKYVAKELGVRSFCLPDAGLQHFLREATRLLELLGATEGHMLLFRAWTNTVSQTVHANYEIPYSAYGSRAPQI